MNSQPNSGNKNPKQPQTVTLSPANGSRPQTSRAEDASSAIMQAEAFDQPVIFQQTALWSRAILWGIVGVTVFTIGWAAIAKVEEAVPATGKLEPVGAVQEVDVPVDGVVEELLVRNGDHVEQGDVLMRLDTTATEAQLQSLTQVRNSLALENAFYRSQILGVTPDELSQALELDLPTEVLLLTRNRNALLQENQLYQSILSGSVDQGSLSLDQLARLQAIQIEAQTRTNAAQLEVSQAERQLAENQVQLEAARENLAINQEILADVTPLVEEGGLARLQYTRQQQEVLNSQAEVNRLQVEQQRLEFAIAQAGQQFDNTRALTSTDLLNRMAENDKRISEIDSQINTIIIDNEQRIAELDSQIQQAQLTLQYQEVRAPISGIVFDMQAQLQGVVGNTPEPVLKIVPSEDLIARVYITNRDIGFVEQGMDVDVRIDSFPFSEFGDIQGTLTWIGSDALPPDEIRPVYTFPAEIELDQQFLPISGREVPLQSGMSVSVNIKIRQRTILSIFTDLFIRKVESITTSR